MGHPVRSLVVAALAAVIGASWCGCTLNATGEGAYDRADASVGGGGSGGWLPDSSVEDVTAQDAIPDLPGKPDVPCFPPMKVCDSTCDYPNPFIMGCSPNNNECDPCPQFAHAEDTCLNGACAIKSCDPLWADCDSNPTNGCEKAINTLEDCGACGTSCSRDNATADCSTGECKIAQCSAPFADCNGVDSDGCEANLHSMDNCGACNTPCTGPGPAQYTCATGVCKVDKCTAPLTADCDGVEANGCEVDLTTLNNCGACGVTCDRNHATPTCAGGTCAIAKCDTNYGDCNSQDNDGCETNLLTSAQNCGSCGGACSTSHSTNAACQNGLCVNTCDNGWADCNGPQPGNLDDGCETNIATDPSHCGGCAKPCSTNNVPTLSCTNGVCDGACAPGYADCNSDKLSDGCEINLLSDVKNCGVCGHVCSNNGGTPSCVNGQCTIACSPGHADCDGNVANGCEVNTTNDTGNCGSCGKVCSLPNASATCTNSLCAVASCATGYADCNHVASDGCEINTTNTVNNCGGCGTICSSANIPTPVCSGSKCTGTCAAGWADCNNNKQTDGCEVHIDADVNNCGTCGKVCNLPNATEGCSGGQCTVMSCASGYMDCNGTASDGCEIHTAADVNNCGSCGKVCSLPNASATCTNSLCAIASCANGYVDCNHTANDGCEIDTTTNVDNCGGCGTVCSSANIPTRVCSGSKCTGTCASGWADCNNNKQTDGCEVHTDADVNNCGSCNTVCSFANASATCTSGACAMGSCNSGYADCDSNATNGCEIDLNTDPAHCGACLRPCNSTHVASGGLSCSAGLCDTTACDSGWTNVSMPAAPAPDDGCEKHN